MHNQKKRTGKIRYLFLTKFVLVQEFLAIGQNNVSVFVSALEQPVHHPPVTDAYSHPFVQVAFKLSFSLLVLATVLHCMLMWFLTRRIGSSRPIGDSTVLAVFITMETRRQCSSDVNTPCLGITLHPRLQFTMFPQTVGCPTLAKYTTLPLSAKNTLEMCC